MTLRTLLWTLLLAAACDDTTPATPGKQLLPIGSACAQDKDCGTAQPYFCDTDSPAGYCEAVCHKDTDCPTNSVCVGAALKAPGACHLRCSQPLARSECRVAQGYTCVSMPPDASFDYCAPPDNTPDGG